MRRILVYLNFVSSPVPEPEPDILIDVELARLIRRAPRTKAEREFYRWLKHWQENLETGKGNHAREDAGRSER